MKNSLLNNILQCHHSRKHICNLSSHCAPTGKFVALARQIDKKLLIFQLKDVPCWIPKRKYTSINIQVVNNTSRVATAILISFYVPMSIVSGCLLFSMSIVSSFTAQTRLKKKKKRKIIVKSSRGSEKIFKEILHITVTVLRGHSLINNQ